MITTKDGRKWYTLQEKWPDIETPIHAIYNNEIRVLYRSTEHPMPDEWFQSFEYWDDQFNEGSEIDPDLISLWTDIGDYPDGAVWA